MSQKEKAQLIADFEALLMEAILAGGGPRCSVLMQSYLERMPRTEGNTHGLPHRRHSHERTS